MKLKIIEAILIIALVGIYSFLITNSVKRIKILETNIEVLETEIDTLYARIDILTIPVVHTHNSASVEKRLQHVYSIVELPEIKQKELERLNKIACKQPNHEYLLK